MPGHDQQLRLGSALFSQGIMGLKEIPRIHNRMTRCPGGNEKVLDFGKKKKRNSSLVV